MNGSTEKPVRFSGYRRVFVYLKILFYYFFYTLRLKTTHFHLVLEGITKHGYVQGLKINYLIGLVDRVLYFKLFGKQVVRVNCLRYSIVIYKICSDYGVDVELNIGVDKKGDRFLAHAWITKAGKILYDAKEKEFALIYRMNN